MSFPKNTWNVSSFDYDTNFASVEKVPERIGRQEIVATNDCRIVHDYNFGMTCRYLFDMFAQGGKCGFNFFLVRSTRC